MQHEQALPLLSPYIDGELAPDTRAQLESHLATCPLCQVELQSLRQASALLHGMSETPFSNGFLPRLHEAIESSSRRAIGGAERFVGLLSGIAACLALLGILAIFRPATAAPLSPSAWETAAVQPQATAEETALASSDNETAIGQWMVANLSSQGTGSEQ